MANCADITKFGIFDISRTSKEEELSISFLKWVRNQDFGSYEQANNSAFNFGLTLPKIPVGIELGKKDGNRTANSWSKDFTEFLENNIEVKKDFNQEFITANNTIVKAWQSCVENSRGLSCWAEQTDNPKEILLRIEVKPLTFPFPKLKIKVIHTSPHVTTHQKIHDQLIGAEPISILYERVGRNWNESVNFIVQTNDANYQDDCKAPATNIEDDKTGTAVPGLIAKWTANDTATDQLGKYDALASQEVTYVDGVYGKAFNFDGNKSIVVTPLTVSYSNGITFSAWVKTNSDFAVILADGGGSSGHSGMGFFMEINGQLCLLGTKGDDTGNFTINLGDIIRDDKFHHLVGTWTGDTTKDGVRFYVDGELKEKTTALAPIHKADLHMCMGRHDKLNYLPFRGAIDDVSIYNRPLTDKEVKKLSKR